MQRKCCICKNVARFKTPKNKALCSAECGSILAQAEYTKVKEKEFVVRKKNYKEDNTTHQKKLTQDVFNKLRRLQCIKWFHEQGREPECVSCGKKNMDWACGHYKTVGSSDNLRFDPLNTFLQCNAYCNDNLSGNISGNKNTRGYTQGLHDLFGADQAKEILDYLEVEQHKIRRFDGKELKKMRAQFNKEIRALE